jgi:hypothetical protein
VKPIVATLLIAFLTSAPNFLAANQDFEELLKAGIFLDNLPPWELYEAPPSAITQDPPVYLDVDSKGNVYAKNITVTKDGTYNISDVILTEIELAEIEKTRNVVFRDIENNQISDEPDQNSMLLGSTSCPLPPSFSISGTNNGPVSGVQDKYYTSRPGGATTQWLVFDFHTVNFRNAGTHMFMPLFWDDVLHGWGAFIGDNHEGNGCGSSSRFNSQIEGWIQTDPQTTPPDDPIPGPDWQSYTFNGSNSCGNEMYDGKIYVYPNFIPRYRFEMQASTGHWVAYRIQQRFNGSSTWQTLTDWKALDTDTGSYTYSPLNWLSGTEGIFIGALNGSATAGSWSVNMYNVDCGWF